MPRRSGIITHSPATRRSPIGVYSSMLGYRKKRRFQYRGCHTSAFKIGPAIGVCKSLDKMRKATAWERCPALTLRTTCGGKFARWTPQKMGLPQKLALADMIHATKLLSNFNKRESMYRVIMLVSDRTQGKR